MAHRIERFSTEIEACLSEKFPDVFDPLISNLIPYEDTRGWDEVSMDEDFGKDSLVEEIRKILWIRMEIRLLSRRMATVWVSQSIRLSLIC